MAMIAKRLGFSVVLLEKGSHPRIVIGESSTPLSNLLLELIVDKYDLPALRPLTKWGTWQKAYPEVCCGLKRGFTFFHHNLTGPNRNPTERQLLVAASPNDAIADTHWFRASFDELLVQQARAAGVTYIDECEVLQIEPTPGWTLHCLRKGEVVELQADFIIDATGPKGLMHRALDLQEASLPGYSATSALFAHFTGVRRFHGSQRYAGNKPPYPPDDAALHHVFDGGWMWILHFNNGWTSAGVAATDSVAKRLGFAEREAGWHRLLASLPEVHEQFARAQRQTPFTFVPQLSFRSATIAGKNWAMLPSAAGFVDPLLSTGFPLTLLGVLRLGEILERDWATDAFEAGLTHYAAETEGELLATADLIAALYANMGDFTTFKALSLLYFAAASYAETARRLQRPELAKSFLLHTNATFGPALHRIAARARQQLSIQENQELVHEILSLVDRFDVAGLCKQPSDHCYPVRADDLFAGAHKVQASAEEIEILLRRTGFYAAEG